MRGRDWKELDNTLIFPQVVLTEKCITKNTDPTYRVSTDIT